MHDASPVMLHRQVLEMLLGGGDWNDARLELSALHPLPEFAARVLMEINPRVINGVHSLCARNRDELKLLRTECTPSLTIRVAPRRGICGPGWSPGYAAATGRA